MSKVRLDQALVKQGLVNTRSQAESYIKLGKVKLFDQIIIKPGYLVELGQLRQLSLDIKENYVSRAALKLASVAEQLKLDFKNKTVLDVGSSTGGFTDYALKHGATKVIAVEKGTDQLDVRLRGNPLIELHEKTDINDFKTSVEIDLALIDVSFVSLRTILPNLKRLLKPDTLVLAMVKPQFEAANSDYKHKGVIKNDKMRRQILKDFEDWVRPYYMTLNKADSGVKGAKGNQERFYLLKSS